MPTNGRFMCWVLAGLVCFSARATVPTMPPVATLAPTSFAIVNGILLHYEITGEGPPLVMLHGNGGDLQQFHFQIEFFRTHRTVIAIDSRGHGKSEMGSGRLTYDQMAEDVAALVGQLHVGPVDLLGWSDGGIVALLVALHHPDQVRAVAASGANLSPEALRPADLAGMKVELRNAEQKLAAADRSDDWATKCQWLRLMITQPQISAADLARISAPVLVLAGEHDMVPELHTRQIAAGLPRARLEIFAGAGHAVLQELPERFNATVDAFFRDPHSAVAR